MKRIVSLVLALMLAFMALPPSQPASAEGNEPNTFVLPAGLAAIEEQAFVGNTAVNTVIIPNTVTEIQSKAFENCTGLTEVVIAGRDVSIAEDAFEGCSKDVVFYVHSGSASELWAMSRGYRCEPLEEDADAMARFEALIAKGGMNSSMLMSGLYASKCLIVRTHDGQNRLPDISAYNPTDIYRSEENLYYIQFETESDAEDCLTLLKAATDVIRDAEPDRIGENDGVSAQGVTIAEYWGASDTMGFDEYAPFVAQRASGSVTVAVVDSGVSESAWAGKFSSKAASFVGGSAYTDSVRHGSKVASIISDCMGDAVSNATLLPVKVVNSSSLYRTSVIIEGIKHAVNSGADVINMSFGWDKSEGTSPEIAYQISRANSQGVHVVVAAGNGSGQVMFPANCSGALAVSALTYSKASGYSVSSRTGSEIDYTAPGIYLSTSSYPNIDLAGDTIGAASTSFAAPQIAAALSLIELDPTQSGDAVSVLNSCCVELDGLSSSAYGKGLPQLKKLAVVKTEDILLKNMEEKPIPTRLWLGDAGSNFLLSWEIVPENASSKLVTVTTSDSSVVSVQQFGNTHALIAAKGLGEAVITVTNGVLTKQLTIVVEQPVTEILIAGAPGRMVVGDEVQLAAAALPENATNQSVAWTSSNDEVLSVTEGGLLQAKAAGQATITCTAKDGYGASAKTEITVLEVPDAASITLTAKEKDISSGVTTLAVGETLTLQVQVLPENALQQVSYSLFPQGVVTISENGVVKAVAPGSATIMVTAASGQNVYTGLTVNVVIYPESISVSAAKPTLDIGGTTVMSAKILPEDATNKAVVWTSLNPEVAAVDKNTGLVTAIAPGTAEIVGATVNGKQASAVITVRQPITITFDPGEGVCAETTRAAFSGYEIGALPEATREYWQLDGWFTEESGGVKVTAQSTFTADTTLYAQYTGLPYTITFDPNGGSCDTAEMTARVGEKIGYLPTPTRDYYTFIGWRVNPEKNSQRITVNYMQDTNEDLTVYASWRKNPYTMTFDANGGLCDIESITGSVNTAIGELPVPTRDYYIFDGWFTAVSDGTEITETYVNTTDNPVTAYAHWTPMSYTITFNPNGGSCDVTELECQVDTNVGTLPVPKRDYYTFGGWYIEGETSVHVLSTYRQTTNEDITVKARWIPRSYKVTFDANGGLCDTEYMMASVDHALGELPVPTRDYYVFAGWFDAEDNRVTEDYVQPTTAAFTLYAGWMPMTYTITLDPNGGECGTATIDYPVDTEIIAMPLPTRAYHTFEGWYTAAEGGTLITTGYSQATNDNITVYAHWTPNPYTVTLNANGGSCSIGSKTAWVDAAIGELPTPTREYYIFDGWFTAASGGAQVTADHVQHTDDALALYAHWTPMTYTMQFDVNGENATTAYSAVTYSVGTPVGTLQTPARPYFTFNGWYTAAEGGTKITETYAHSSTATIRVYAHWTENPYSDWVLESAVPGNARVVDTKWKYTETKTTTTENLSGWTLASSKWVQSGSGSFNYASFQYNFNTSNGYYTAYNRSPYTSYETSTAKRTVSNSVSKYVYWHWIYDVVTANGFVDRAIYYDNVKSPASMTGTSRYYTIFEAFESYENTTTTADITAGGNGNWGQDDTYYSWFKRSESGYRSGWWYKTPVYLCSYTDYVKHFTYTRQMETASQPTASDTVSNIVKWVRYQVK